MLHGAWLMLHAYWLLLHAIWLMLHAPPESAPGLCCTRSTPLAFAARSYTSDPLNPRRLRLDPLSRAEIDRHIAQAGVSLRAVSDAVACDSCGQDLCASHAELLSTEPDDGFVYSIGHRLRGRPDLVVLCGQGLKEETPVDHMTILHRMNEAADLVNYLVSKWDTDPVLPEQTCADGDGFAYVVMNLPNLVTQAKREWTLQASEYYGDENYELLVLMPIMKLARPSVH